jgi:hypothetical protein
MEHGLSQRPAHLLPTFPRLVERNDQKGSRMRKHIFGFEKEFRSLSLTFFFGVVSHLSVLIFICGVCLRMVAHAEGEGRREGFRCRASHRPLLLLGISVCTVLFLATKLSTRLDYRTILLEKAQKATPNTNVRIYPSCCAILVRFVLIFFLLKRKFQELLSRMKARKEILEGRAWLESLDGELYSEIAPDELWWNEPFTLIETSQNNETASEQVLIPNTLTHTTYRISFASCEHALLSLILPKTFSPLCARQETVQNSHIAEPTSACTFKLLKRVTDTS